MRNPNDAPGEPYVPPIKIFGEGGVFSEYSGDEIAEFGDYPPMTLSQVVEICGQHWVDDFIAKPDIARAAFRQWTGG